MNKQNYKSSMRRKNNMAIAAQNSKSVDNTGFSGSNAKGMSCSTPESKIIESSPCNSDSDAASPVPFLCTQDGSYGDTEVVWNYYTPRQDKKPKRTAQHTPLSTNSRRTKFRNKIEQLCERNPTSQVKKRPKDCDKKNQLFQDLFEMNKNIQGIIERTQKQSNDKRRDVSGSEEDIFNSSGDSSPKHDSFSRSNTRCLRRNLLSSKFNRPEPEPALESDDSMNECLIRASQMIEEKVFNEAEPENKIENDSVDALLTNVIIDSPVAKKKKIAPIGNDSFDNYFGNLNDSALERLTQLPIINESVTHLPHTVKTNNFQLNNNPALTSNTNSGWTIKELIAMDSVPSPRSSFSRHNSMPVSPAPLTVNKNDRSVKPSSTGTALSRHSSMPWKTNKQGGNSSEDSTPLRCTPEEIKRKREQAREKLHAKRLFPNSQSDSQPKPKFQPKVATRPTNTLSSRTVSMVENVTKTDIKSIIEKKRMEALQKLRMKQTRH